jgi:tRNA U34 5-carboxymethylaminomethyl modifying GTPase MnmE/TrmE
VNDIIRARVRTTGIVEEELRIRKVPFKFVDVGGQRNERKKWIHSFENVAAVIYVVAMQEYDQVLFEDNKVNRLVEARELFQKTVMDQWFMKTPMILFLNKSDLFKEKLCKQKIPLNVTGMFPTAPKSFKYEDGLRWIQDFTLDGLPARRVKDVYIFDTCATDTQGIDKVFAASSQIILKQNLGISGLTMMK